MKSFTAALTGLLALSSSADWGEGLRDPSGVHRAQRFFSVTTTREVASTYGSQWNIQREGSQRLRYDVLGLGEDLVQLNVLVGNDDEADHFEHLESTGVLTYEVMEEDFSHRHLFGADLDMPMGLRAVPSLSCYRTVDETSDSMDALAEEYPDFVRLDTIGESSVRQVVSKDDGYDIKIMVLSAPSDYVKHAMMLVGGHHSRELPPPELLMQWAEHLLANYGTDADITWILERTNFHIVPIANPDGRTIVQEHLEWWYRKNAHEYGCANGTALDGVDLNRNYPFMWGYDSGSSGDECAYDFRGPEPLSEPESRAVYNYAHNLFDKEFKRGDVNESLASMNVSCSHEATGIFIDVHSYGDFVYFPYGYADVNAPDHRSLLTMASKLAQPGNYSLWGPGQDGFLYFVSGDSTDSLYGIDCIPAFGYEIGSEFYANCTELDGEILPIMKESLLYAAKSVSAPYKIPLGPDLMDICVDNTDPKKTTMTVEVSDEALIVSHTIFEGDLSQSIEKVQVFFDVHPFDAGAEGIFMEAVDGAFDSTEEQASYWLDSSSWEGRHVLYFQATDSHGNAGPVSAVFVDHNEPNSCAPQVKTSGGDASSRSAASSVSSEESTDRESSAVKFFLSFGFAAAAALVGLLL